MRSHEIAPPSIYETSDWPHRRGGADNELIDRMSEPKRDVVPEVVKQQVIDTAAFIIKNQNKNPELIAHIPKPVRESTIIRAIKYSIGRGPRDIIVHSVKPVQSNTNGINRVNGANGHLVEPFPSIKTPAPALLATG